MLEMTLREAMRLVGIEERADRDDPTLTDQQAAKLQHDPQHGCDHEDVDGAITNNPALNQAYHTVLNATDSEIERA